MPIVSLISSVPCGEYSITVMVGKEDWRGWRYVLVTSGWRRSLRQQFLMELGKEIIFGATTQLHEESCHEFR
jgi:hypothetical protein